MADEKMENRDLFEDFAFLLFKQKELATLMVSEHVSVSSEQSSTFDWIATFFHSQVLFNGQGPETAPKLQILNYDNDEDFVYVISRDSAAAIDDVAAYDAFIDGLEATPSCGLLKCLPADDELIGNDDAENVLMFCDDAYVPFPLALTACKSDRPGTAPVRVPHDAALDDISTTAELRPTFEELIELPHGVEAILLYSTDTSMTCSLDFADSTSLATEKKSFSDEPCDLSAVVMKEPPKSSGGIQKLHTHQAESRQRKRMRPAVE